MEDGSSVPTMATAAMVGRWKVRAMQKISTTNGSFTRKKKAGEAPAMAAPDPVDGKLLVHGAVRFPGSRLRPAKWARISHEASMTDVVQLITRTWGLTPPSSLISIIGSSDRECRQVFAGPGLKRAAETTSAWILTDGTYEGIGGLVGPHVQPLPCVGVPRWSSISESEVLKPSRTTIVNRMQTRNSAGAPQSWQPPSPPASPPGGGSFTQRQQEQQREWQLRQQQWQQQQRRQQQQQQQQEQQRSFQRHHHQQQHSVPAVGTPVAPAGAPPASPAASPPGSSSMGRYPGMHASSMSLEFQRGESFSSSSAQQQRERLHREHQARRVSGEWTDPSRQVHQQLCFSSCASAAVLQ